MARMKGVPGQAFDISSIWISDEGRFEFILSDDQSIVRTGPTIADAEAFAALIHQVIEDHRKSKT